MNKILVAAMGVAIAALGGMQWYSNSQLRSLESTVKSVEAQQAAVEKSLSEEIERRAQREQEQLAGQEQAIDSMREEVQRARTAANGAAGKVQAEAQARYESLAAQLREAEQRLADNQARVTAELSGVRQANAATQSGIGTVSTKVDEVQSQASATKAQLSTAVADLQRIRGDLGQLSGLIATNAKQLEALRALGDREYTEFTLFRRPDPVPLGAFSVVLKKTDDKNQRYSIDLIVNDRRIEKKDRTINEPLQFYMTDRSHPYELVVNEVRKDQVVGYLAAPKTAPAPSGEGAR